MSKQIWILAIAAFTIRFCRNSQSNWFGGAPHRISASGYDIEIHNVTTVDGYILELHRIPFSPNNKSPDLQRPIILFVHGLFSSSDCFLINGVQNSLGFQAAAEGYDVWLVNTRGNRYSSKHVNLSTFSQQFWSFSFHEMAIYDLPGTIDYILRVTRQKALHFIGHSLASHIYMVLLSEKPEYNTKLRSGHLLSAGLHPKDTATLWFSFGEVGIKLSNLLNYGSFGIYQYFTPFNYFLWLISQTYVGKVVVKNVLDKINGPSNTLNMTALPDILATIPSGSSARNFVHALQGTFDFRQMNFGEQENRRRYGKSLPPMYNLSNIEVPTYIHYGGQDKIIVPAVIKNMTNQFPKKSLKKVFVHDHFNHLDFYSSVESKQRINDVIFKIIWEFEK